MSIFKCKMCGGTIEFEQGATVGVCDSCGTKQTLPRLDDDRRANLYDRANHFRRNNEFDKAAAIYEQILTEDTTDAEAYWSLVLCQYGIEYVEDPATHKRVPTVNRAQFTSIFDDDNYRSALQHADVYQRTLYEDEAAAINEIQKGILAISQKEEPFDVFICYKETDNNGRRTPDSVLANDLYHQLVQEGFKVFFARITLEDKLGTAYEPYIFAALNSAKVMVVLGTKPEHFNAVWVKNEWSRYLALVKKSGGKKILIPAYKDMDPYDLPDEFSHLQAQDMSKLGFMQDLIRGIKKIVTTDEPKAVVKETVVVDAAANANVAPLLKRAFMFLEDSDWKEADAYCEKVLDQDPENAQAYLGKLMAELKVRKQEELKDCKQPFDDRANFQKAVRFGDEALSAALNGYIVHINERNETARLTGIYNEAVSAMNEANSGAAYIAAAETFKTIPGFQDADSLVEQCLEKAEICRKDAIYKSAKSYMEVRSYEAASEKFRLIPGWKDADEQAEICKDLADKESIYAEAMELFEGRELTGPYGSYRDGQDFDGALTLFETIPDYRDTPARIEECKKGIQNKKEKEQNRKKAAKITAIIFAIAAVVGVFILVLTTVIIPKQKLNKAMGLLDSGDYEAAYALLAEIGNSDAIASSKYDRAVALIDSGDYEAAYILLNGLNHKDSADKAAECLFLKQKAGLTNVKVGSTIKFGLYEQDNKTKNGKEEIEWKVLAVKGNKALVISQYALDCQNYNSKYIDTAWEKCTLSTWLNGTFCDAAFSADHQKMIASSTVTADKNPSYNTSPGNNTTDKVFLLSITEANKYFKSDEARKCAPTDYAIAQGAWTVDSDKTGGRAACRWWLRTPGYRSHFATSIRSDGTVTYYGDGVYSASAAAVRPAMWISLDS